jgi:hypothetical protein
LYKFRTEAESHVFRVWFGSLWLPSSKPLALGRV